jgi:hypothetical protein
MSARAVVRTLAIILVWAGTSAAHEERLAVGRVETVDPTRKLLVVAPTDAERRRLDLTPETEVFVCRGGSAVTGIRVGQTVRVKYLDKPGSPPEAQWILVRSGGR